MKLKRLTDEELWANYKLWVGDTILTELVPLDSFLESIDFVVSDLEYEVYDNGAYGIKIYCRDILLREFGCSDPQALSYFDNRLDNPLSREQVRDICEALKEILYGNGEEV